ncbi:MAG: DUF1972 domain-containing protein [Nocardioidaceae bacterium]|nr:DUF1972 domain-containing protein [Nocardioidaceae bacterium]
MSRTVRILGTHGVPAAYGGFETAAEAVARFLVGRGWRVVVYCQVPGDQPRSEDRWEGIERVNIPIARDGWLGTSEFDLRSVAHASRFRDVCLTFGYNTAVLNTAQRALRIPNAINMDGIEWSRARWGPVKQGILYANERIGCVVGDRLIADHPEIETYLRRRAPARKITMITYGADAVHEAGTEALEPYGLTPGGYLTLVARPIPENSILEIVRGFSERLRGRRLVVVGGYDPGADEYHREVFAAASDEVQFVGGVYDRPRLDALRLHSLGYLHGHTVGGTNPSLVEALAAGNPVIAHDNPYNRWVAQDAALYFRDAREAGRRVDELLESPGVAARLSAAARERHRSEFTWEQVAGEYEELLLELVQKNARRRRRTNRTERA